MSFARVARRLAVAGAVTLLALGAIAPARAAGPLTDLRRTAGVWLRDVPEPLIVAAALLAAVVLWFLLFRSLLVLAYRGWRRVSARVYWALTLVLPKSPLVKFAAGAMVLIAAVLLIIGGLPVLVGSFADAADGPASYVDEFGESRLNGEWNQLVDGDVVAGGPACDGAAAGATDRDGDGLPDAWERAGESPGGAPLPGASPDRRDLFVQLDYGADVDPLSSAERGQLRDVWARMPVDNPDGSSGVDLHLVADADGAGTLGQPAVFTGTDGHARYYTTEYLGPRHCVYRQVVYGELELGSLAGLAPQPGYAVVVDGSPQPDYEGSADFRVALTTHELLHAVAGPVEGRDHTDEGWLAGGPGNEFLSNATARELTAEGLYGPAS